MRFKLVKTGKTYAEPSGGLTKTSIRVPVSQPDTIRHDDSNQSVIVPSVIWETGNVGQIQSLLIVREAELMVAKAQLTENPVHDWYINNNITHLEIMISDLKKWLNEAMKRRDL
jgi:hypothetical protein